MSIIDQIFAGIEDPRRAVNKIVHSLFSVVGQRNYRQFIIVTRDRSGSNLLRQFLNSHPSIKVDGEIFHNLAGRTEEEILSRSFSKQPFYIKAKGFKIFYYQPMDSDSSKIWSILHNLHGLHVIHLKRKNILKTEVSSKIAYATGVWRVKPGDKRPNAVNNTETINYPVDKLRKRFEQTRSWEAAADERFGSHPKITVYYEDLVRESDQIFNEVTDFLGVEYRPPKAILKKQATRGLREMIENYDVLKAAFVGSEWQSFFEE